MKKLLISTAIALGIANTALALTQDSKVKKGRLAAQYERILGADPQNWTTRSYLGVVLLRSGDINGARKQLALIGVGCGTTCASWKRLAGWIVCKESREVDEIAEDWL